jgi:hypothetical protein
LVAALDAYRTINNYQVLATVPPPKTLKFTPRAKKAPITENPQMLAAAIKDLRTSRGQLFEKTRKNCDDLVSLNGFLLPSAKYFSSRGIDVDILVPPYSLLAYADWYVKKWNVTGGTPSSAFNDLMLLRKCTVYGVNGLASVRVHAFDEDDSLVGDLSNYRNPTHLENRSAYEKILKGIAAGTHVLTPENWPDYQRTLAARVAAFTIKAKE